MDEIRGQAVRYGASQHYEREYNVKSKLRVAVIGAGAIAQRRHLPEYAYRKDVELIGLSDPRLERAKQIAAQFKVPFATADFRKLLAMKPDAVSVCSPNAFHAPQAIAALKAGAHVLVEKPMAGSVTEARAMIKAARAARRQLMVGHNQRYAPSHLRGKRILKSGHLGRVLGFSTVFAHPGPEGWSVDLEKCHFFRKRQTLIGCLADLGVHKIDLVRWLLDDEIVQVVAMLDNLSKPSCQVEDTAFAVLRMKSGVLGQMYAGWAHNPGCDNATQVFCEKGILKLECDENYPVIVEYANGDRDYIKTSGIGNTDDKNANPEGSGIIDEFVSAILAGRKVSIPGEEGARSLAAVLACVQAARSGKVVRVASV